MHPDEALTRITRGRREEREGRQTARKDRCAARNESEPRCVPGVVFVFDFWGSDLDLAGARVCGERKSCIDHLERL
eukprot:2875326-Rhodomonas_salina.2